MFIMFNEIMIGVCFNWVFGCQLCMYCDYLVCVFVCLIMVFMKIVLGFVVFNELCCIGCCVCMQVCLFLILKYDYENFVLKIYKCMFCVDWFEVGFKLVCVMVCLIGVISFGDWDDMVVEVKCCIVIVFGMYIFEIYGLDEVGGISVLYLLLVLFVWIGYVIGLLKMLMLDFMYCWLCVMLYVFGVFYVVFGVLMWIFYWCSCCQKEGML